MSLPNVALYLHVLGAMAYAAATLISLLGLVALRRACRVDQARPLLALMEVTGPVSGIGLLVLLLAGLYMTAAVWGWRTAWINVALGSLVVLLLPVGAVMGIRRHALAVRAKQLPDGLLPEALYQRIQDPLLGASTVMLVTLLLGVVFLMTAKPLLAGALSAMGVGIVLGVVFSLPFWRREAQASKAVNPCEPGWSPN